MHHCGRVVGGEGLDVRRGTTAVRVIGVLRDHDAAVRLRGSVDVGGEVVELGHDHTGDVGGVGRLVDDVELPHEQAFWRLAKGTLKVMAPSLPVFLSCRMCP